MKKSTFLLYAVLCAGLANSSHAQVSESTTYATALSAGQHDFKAENYEAATKNAAESLALAKSPEQTGDALTLLGETYYRRKMYDEAQMQWAKMLELQETGENEGVHLIAHLGSARSYSAQSQWDKAVPEYQSVISQTEIHLKTDGDANATETRQTLAPLYFALANAYSHNKQYDLAGQQLKQVIRYSEGDSGFRLFAFIKKGQIDLIQRDFKGALDSFNQALALTATEPDSPPTKVVEQIKNLIPLLQNLAKAEVGAGQANDGKPRTFVAPPPELNEVSDTFSQVILDSFFDGLVSDSPEE